MKAVIYKRVSTNIQVTDGTSLETQEEKLRAYCIIQGWDIVNVYEDAGLSGKNTDRPAFKQMMKDAQDKKFDVIVVYKLDRLTRSVKDFHELAEKLDTYNVSLVSVTQNLDTSTPVGRLLRNILVDFANFEREMIVERTMDSKYSLAEKGSWLGGVTPFGYRVDSNKNLLIEPQEALIVKEIFTDYLRGTTTRQLVLKYGMSLSKIVYILRNPVYTGMIGYSKSNQVKKGVKTRKPIDEWILAEGSHEAIISKEEWDRVQRIKANNVKNPKSRSIIQIFEGLCWCECGNKLYFYFTRGKERTLKYYRCAHYGRAAETCGFSIREEAIEPRVIQRLSQIINDKTFWKEVERQVNSEIKTDTKADIKKYESEYNKNKKTISNLIIHMGQEEGMEIAHLIAPQIKKLELRQKELQTLIDEKKAEGDKIVSLENTRLILTDYIKIWERMTREEKRTAAKIIIKKMVITKERIEITLNDDNMPVIIC